MKLKITPGQAKLLREKYKAAPAFTWSGIVCTCDIQDLLSKEYWARGQGPTEEAALEAALDAAEIAPRPKSAAEVAAEVNTTKAENESLKAKLAELEALAAANQKDGLMPRRARRVPAGGLDGEVPTEPDSIRT